MEAETPEVRAFIRKHLPAVLPWQKISNGISIRIALSTLAWICGVVVWRRWADSWAVSAVAFAVIAALQHRINILHHESIHRLLFSHRLLNDWVGHHLFGASILTPSTYRLYHFKHHRELGRESDPDFPGYSPFPTSGWQVAQFLLENLVGMGVFFRFLAETRSAVGKNPSFQAYHESRGWGTALAVWSAVCLVQALVLGLFVLSGGTAAEFLLFWALPEITLTRTLMAVRLMGEHASRGEEFPVDTRYLVTLPSNFLERFFFAPLAFHYHAEHHLFPAVPWHRLGRLHRRLMKDPEYRRIVGVRRGYLLSVLRDCIRRPR